MDKIHIQELEASCIIGTRSMERNYEQKVVIDIVLECDLTKAGQSDDITDTVNYKDLKDDVLEMIRASSFYLLEKMADEIAAICLARPGVESVTVNVRKPGALTGARTVGVEITRQRV